MYVPRIANVSDFGIVLRIPDADASLPLRAAELENTTPNGY